jgi:phosphomannomutase
MLAQSIFRPYNIRGTYPSELDEDGAYAVAQAFAGVLKPKKVAVGRDARLSGPKLQDATMRGFVDAGVDVVDLGMITTDQLYWASGAKGLDGIQVSASHNPPEWNGMKFIKKGVVPLSDEEIRNLYGRAQDRKREISSTRGKTERKNTLHEYAEFLLKFINPGRIKPFKVVVNPLSGTAGPLVEEMVKNLPIEIVPLNMKPDGHFPKGNPDPFVPSMREETAAEVKKTQANLGVSWDNDSDRCAFFDDSGEFIPGAFTTALLAQYFLNKYPGSKILSEVRVIWPVKETVEAAGGIHILNKPGHAFIKERMRQDDVIFGGELSGHYFLRDFWYADNGFIPFLILLELLSESGKKLSDLVAPFRAKYFFSEEVSFPLAEREDADPILDKLAKRYADGTADRISGLSVAYKDWRFNIRPSDTEPKIRLIVEARSQKLLDEKTAELTEFVKGLV